MKARVLTALALIPIVLAGLFLSDSAPLAVLALVVFVAGFQELLRLAGENTPRVPVVGLLLLAVTLGIVARHDRTSSAFISGAALMSSLGLGFASMVLRGKRSRLTLDLAGMWVAGPLLCIILLHAYYAKDGQPFTWRTPVLFAFVPLWIGDTAAIFAGKAFGKRLLAPSISPKKTVEGGIANLAGCILAGLGVAVAIHVPVVTGLLCGLAAGILGQAGDLFQSALKRAAGLKDSGALLPGHGGILDRIDSILFTAPAVALIVVSTLGAQW